MHTVRACYYMILGQSQRVVLGTQRLKLASDANFRPCEFSQVYVLGQHISQYEIQKVHCNIL